MGVVQAKSDIVIPSTGPNVINNLGFNGPYSNDGSNSSKIDGKEWPSSKYYDLYDYSTISHEYQRGKLGDGTKEFGPFYQIIYKTTNITGPTRYIGSYNADYAAFANSNYPWFTRGGIFNFGADAGVSAFDANYGSAHISASFRIVLTP